MARRPGCEGPSIGVRGLKSTSTICRRYATSGEQESRSDGTMVDVGFNPRSRLPAPADPLQVLAGQPHVALTGALDSLALLWADLPGDATRIPDPQRASRHDRPFGNR